MLVVGLQLAALYIPFLSSFFDVLPLSFCDLDLQGGAGALVLVAMEVEKRIQRKRDRASGT